MQLQNLVGGGRLWLVCKWNLTYLFTWMSKVMAYLYLVQNRR